jgi:hypothetical protein
MHNWNALMLSSLQNGWEVAAFESFLDWQWEDYLSKQIPQEYIDEIKGKS